MISKVAVSVIVPIYNVEQYLAECLDAIEVQQWDASDAYEVLLIDDGSQDQSGSIAETYIRKHENWTLVHQTNRGLSAARNEGVQRARGTYVCFVDSDDYIEPGYLQRLYQAAVQYKADMVITDFYEVSERGERLQEREQYTYPEGILDRDTALTALLQVVECHEETVIVVAWNKLIRREIMLTCLYPEGKLHEDEFVIMPLLLRCNTIIWLQQDLYAYRQRRNSIKQQAEQAWRHLEILDAFEERISLCKLYNAKLYDSMQKRYFWDIETWYHLMRTKYGFKWFQIYGYFSKRMWRALFRYCKALGKGRRVRCILFAIAPELYYILKRHSMQKSKEDNK